MTRHNRSTLLKLFVAFALSYFVLLALFFQETRDYAIFESEKHIENALLTHRAMHSYIEDIQKPEIYRLKREGKLYEEYFSPKVLSFTYIARGVKSFLNDERRKSELPEIYFKLASTNPRNPVNTADEFEMELLERMNRQGLEEYKAIHDIQGKSYLYYAIPISANKDSCMRCHGDPQDAPRELVDSYGDERGFYEKLGDIRAMISIRIPLDSQLGESTKIFLALAGVTLAIFSAVFATIWYFVRRLDRQEQTILEQNAELQVLSQTDYLTKLSNRNKFHEAMAKEMAQSVRYDEPLGLILLDIDHFKQINDSQGHAVGDKVLAGVATLLMRHTREADIVARWGGEEFVIAAPHTTLEGTVQLAESLRAELEGHRDETYGSVTASFGVTLLHSGDSVERLVDRADGALYRAKRNGRNRVEVDVPAESA